MTTATEIHDPTTCDSCGVDLERGWSERWRDGKRVGATCIPCADDERLRAYLETKIITTNLMIREAIVSARGGYAVPEDGSVASVLAEVHESTKKIQWTVGHYFEPRVWFRGLQAQVRDASHRGFRASFGATGTEYLILVYSLAGRTMITLQSADESQSVTLITDESSASPVMGIQGIHAMEMQAIAMITASCRAHEDGMRFERDDKIGMA